VIRVDIRLDHQQRLKGFSVSGHSGTAKRGEDLVCAAASFLFRTAARALQLEPDVVVRGTASRDGQLEAWITAVAESRREWLAGLSDFLVRGARDLQEENPGAITLTVTEGEA
jgi:uncharacterized protein YsxB (DUF464 family)